MTVKEAAQLFQDNLKTMYPADEITAICGAVFNHFMGYKSLDLILKKDAPLSQQLEGQIYDIIGQLSKHRPVQYVLNTAFFYELPLFVDESVLIPRPETEELVHWILADNKRPNASIIDLCTGSGCIAIALAKNTPMATVSALDISTKALQVAKTNAQRNNVAIEFIEANILAKVDFDKKKFDIIVSNPPYVTQRQKLQMAANVLEYEPHLALFVPETEPLLFYKAIAEFAQVHLHKNGSLYFEINEDLAEETSFSLHQLGFASELRKDLSNKNRMLKAWRND